MNSTGTIIGFILGVLAAYAFAVWLVNRRIDRLSAWVLQIDEENRNFQAWLEACRRAESGERDESGDDFWNRN